MTDMKQETKREEREMDNNLSMRPDQFNKKLTLVKQIIEYLFCIHPSLFILIESKNKSQGLVRSRDSSPTRRSRNVQR